MLNDLLFNVTFNYLGDTKINIKLKLKLQFSVSSYCLYLIH